MCDSLAFLSDWIQFGFRIVYVLLREQISCGFLSTRSMTVFSMPELTSFLDRTFFDKIPSPASPSFSTSSYPSVSS
jgi:hypothetical protein